MAASTPGDDRDDQLHNLGAFIRAQRQLANLSLRQMADLAHVSNPYLSQLERGLHEPSVRVLQSIGRALNLSAETLLAHAGLAGDPVESAAFDTAAAIRRDPALSDEQKQALLSVYRSYVQGNAASRS
jgi:transcriptional regulator with XRE-family HTH domain